MAAGPAPAGFIITMSEPWAQPTVLPEAPEERGGPRRHLAVERHDRNQVSNTQKKPAAGTPGEYYK